MKKLIFAACALAMLCFTKCSKKDSNANPAHNVKITASATAAFSVKVSVIKTGTTTQLVSDAKTAITVPYSYDVVLTTGDQIFIEFSTDAENTISYKVTDNGNVAADSSKELGTRTSTTLKFTAG